VNDIHIEVSSFLTSPRGAIKYKVHNTNKSIKSPYTTQMAVKPMIIIMTAARPAEAKQVTYDRGQHQTASSGCQSILRADSSPLERTRHTSLH
jgi:hypothetical protein